MIFDNRIELWIIWKYGSLGRDIALVWIWFFNTDLVSKFTCRIQLLATKWQHSSVQSTTCLSLAIDRLSIAVTGIVELEVFVGALVVVKMQMLLRARKLQIAPSLWRNYGMCAPPRALLASYTSVRSLQWLRLMVLLANEEGVFNMFARFSVLKVGMNFDHA